MSHNHVCYTAKAKTYIDILRLCKTINTPTEKEIINADSTNIKEIVEPLTTTQDPAILRLIPLIYHKLIATGVSKYLRVHAMNWLERQNLICTATEVRNQHWFKQHCKTFISNKIPIILLKGAAFSHNLYPEDVPRLSVDLDFLVQSKDFVPACNLLSEKMSLALPDPARRATHEKLFERVFKAKNGNYPNIEVHRGLTNPHVFNIDVDILFKQSTPHPAYGSEYIRILSPEDTLLHLAVHAFRDLDFCNHNILDAHEIWTHWKPDTEKLLESAKTWGAQHVLYYLLANSKAVMDAPIATPTIERLRPARPLHLINSLILRSHALVSFSQNSMQRRTLQLFSQITFPDTMKQGVHFQMNYFKTRLADSYLRVKG